MRTIEQLKNIENTMGSLYAELKPIVNDLFGKEAYFGLFMRDLYEVPIHNHKFGSIEYIKALNDAISTYDLRLHLFFNILEGKQAVEKYNNGCRVLLDEKEELLILKCSWAAKQLNDISGELKHFLLSGN